MSVASLRYFSFFILIFTFQKYTVYGRQQNHTNDRHSAFITEIHLKQLLELGKGLWKAAASASGGSAGLWQVTELQMGRKAEWEAEGSKDKTEPMSKMYNLTLIPSGLCRKAGTFFHALKMSLAQNLENLNEKIWQKLEVLPSYQK